MLAESESETETFQILESLTIIDSIQLGPHSTIKQATLASTTDSCESKMSPNKETQRIVLELDGKTITVKKTERFIYFEEEIHETCVIRMESLNIENLEKIRFNFNKNFETIENARDIACISLSWKNTYRTICFYSSLKDVRISPSYEGIIFTENFQFIVKDDKKRTDFVLQMKALFETN